MRSFFKKTQRKVFLILTLMLVMYANAYADGNDPLTEFNEILEKGLESLDEELGPFSKNFFENTQKLFQENDFEKLFPEESLNLFGLDSNIFSSSESLGFWEETETERIYKIKTEDDKKESIDIEVVDDMLTVTKESKDTSLNSKMVESKSLPRDVDALNFETLHENGYLKVKFKKIGPVDKKEKREIQRLRKSLKSQVLKSESSKRAKVKDDKKDEKRGELLGPYGTEKIDRYSTEREL